jgi:tetratricopeptide (TPR) repeat protein
MAANREQVLQSAEKLLSRGKLDQALKEYLRVLEDNPKDISTLNKVGDLYVRMNRPGDSIPYFTRIADYYSKDGFFLKAIAIYKKINKIDPAQLEVYDRLADLYHKQGLVQDARSQYQVLADHYQKNNRLPDAIAVYKKMASIDPADLRIQARLADLYRAVNQKDEAVMQYGLIGSMLLKRGAHDEAAQVFQKALELSPDDAETQRNLVRSLLAQKNTAAAMAVLKAAPRTADSLTLIAEVQIEAGQRAEAVRTLEQALALDASAEPPRAFLGRLRVQEHALDKAVSILAPIVEAATARREFARAAEYLEPVLAADPEHEAALQQMAQVFEAEGNRPEFARVQTALGELAEKRGDPGGAEARYRRALEADPSWAAAATRLQQIGPSPGAAADEGAVQEEKPEFQELILDLDDSTSVHAPQPRVPSIEWEEKGQGLEPVPPEAEEIEEAVEAEEPGAAAEARGARPSPRASRPSGEVPGAALDPLETLIVEAEVFAKYGLIDKAIERLFSLARKRPDLLKVRERLVELLAESKNPALPREAEALAATYTREGRPDDASRVLAQAGLASPGAEAAASPPAPSEMDVPFEEFDFGQPAAPPAAAAGPAPFTDAIDLGEMEPASPPPVFERLAPPPPETPSDTEFMSYEGLGSLLEDEMQKAEDVAPKQEESPLPGIDEENLFADEQKFFNLAEELEKELADEAVVEEPGEISAPQGEVSLEEIFREFKKGVEQQLSAEDYETHYNLGIAYKEMGLVDEAIGEFQLASKDAGRAVECCSMLGHCFLEKGMPQLAINWFRKGLDAPAIGEAETAGMLYDLAEVYQGTGDTEMAYRTFLEVFSLNSNYRDVARRIRDLEAARKNTQPKGSDE